MFEGHNLQRCDCMIYFSESFRVVHREQSESRAHRIGRKDPVEYLTLLLTFPDGGETVDHYIHEQIVNKKRNALAALSINTVKHEVDDKIFAIIAALQQKFPSMADKLNMEEFGIEEPTTTMFDIEDEDFTDDKD